jgi:hypothetical protein
VTATEAALTAPASYDYSYEYDATYGGFLAFSSGTGKSVHYTRTADGVYYNYSYTGDGQDEWPFDVTMNFNRSNTVWTVSPYEPDDTKIGSNNAVGSIFAKLDIRFNNQTKKNYLLTFDFSSTSANILFRQSYNGTDLINANDNATTLWYPTGLITLFIPAYTNYRIQTYTSSAARYFDAWYLKDLGVNGAYDQGIEDGYDDGYDVGYEDGYNNSVSPLWDGLEVAVGVTLNFILFIATLSIFDISLLNIGIVLVSILGLVWVLKALRG